MEISIKEVDQGAVVGYKARPMPQKPYAVRKKRARRIKKLVRWHEKKAAAEAQQDEKKPTKKTTKKAE